MTYDFINMNPPYDIGNKVTSATINTLSDGKCVCLMPLSQYKSNELWRYVESMELADPKMFDDADITDNLCICTLVNNIVDIYTLEELRFDTFNQNYRHFFERNLELNRKTFYSSNINSSYNADRGYNKRWTFAVSPRAICRGAAMDRNSWQWQYNLGDLDEIPITNKKDGTKMYKAWIVDFGKGHEKECNNFRSWWWFEGKDGLATKLCYALNGKGETPSIVIPQIDWETISDTPLWKEGKYDEAVLSEMHLCWNADKTGVVEKQ